MAVPGTTPRRARVDEVLIDPRLTATSEQHLVDLAGEFVQKVR